MAMEVLTLLAPERPAGFSQQGVLGLRGLTIFSLLDRSPCGHYSHQDASKEKGFGGLLLQTFYKDFFPRFGENESRNTVIPS